jgi:hypothetical protein
MKSNVNRKGFTSGAGAEQREPAVSWEGPKTLLELQAAIANLADVFAALWPLDPTPRVLNRLCITYEFAAAYAAAEKDRCSILEEVCDTVLRENARRAVTVGTPLSFQQAKERWRDITELKKNAGGRVGAATAAGGSQQNAGNSQQRQAGAGGAAAVTAGSGRPAQFARPPGGASGGRVGLGRGANAKFNNELVCFHYNNAGRGCSRPAKGNGCDNGRGGAYVHVCNFELGNGTYCFARHPRHANH